MIMERREPGQELPILKKGLVILYPEEHYFGFKKEDDRVIAEIELKRDLEKETWQ